MMIGTSDSARMARHTSRPEISGSIRSRMTKRMLRPEAVDRPPPIARHGDREPLALEVVPDRIGERRLVLDDQDGGGGSRAGAASSRSSGSALIRSPPGGRIGELPNSPVRRNPDLLGDVDGVVTHPLEGARRHVRRAGPNRAAKDRRRASAPRGGCSGSADPRVVHGWYLERQLQVTAAQRLPSPCGPWRPPACPSLRSAGALSGCRASLVHRYIFATFTAWSPMRSRCRSQWRMAEISRRSCATGDCRASICSTSLSIFRYRSSI